MSSSLRHCWTTLACGRTSWKPAGEPAATSFGVLVGDAVGVFNVTVLPQHRRRGYGRAATRAVLRDAHAAGARTAFLHSTPPGVPLYEAMGFHTAENWTAFTP
ncbi:GNAT family N-acetyltransferase [Streptomyces sp. NPDC094143]|uniref:GNAT family N-acetyltransferase n=1 Tax=Streptomyces sp. NPDC094143 TaxID=3155310 RepID=UPI0033276992